MLNVPPTIVAPVRGCRGLMWLVWGLFLIIYRIAYTEPRVSLGRPGNESSEPIGFKVQSSNPAHHSTYLRRDVSQGNVVQGEGSCDAKRGN